MKLSKSTARTTSRPDRGHLSSVLRGGLMPFNYRERTRDILGVTSGESFVQPGSAPIPPVALRYAREPKPLLFLTAPGAEPGRFYAAPVSGDLVAESPGLVSEPLPRSQYLQNALTLDSRGQLSNSIPTESPTDRSPSGQCSADEPLIGQATASNAARMLKPAPETYSNGEDKGPRRPKTATPAPSNFEEVPRLDVTAINVGPIHEHLGGTPDTKVRSVRNQMPEDVPTSSEYPAHVRASDAPRQSSRGGQSISCSDTRGPTPERPISVRRNPRFIPTPRAADDRVSTQLEAGRASLTKAVRQQRELQQMLEESNRKMADRPPEIREVVRHVKAPSRTRTNGPAAFWDRSYMSQPELRLFK